MRSLLEVSEQGRMTAHVPPMAQHGLSGRCAQHAGAAEPSSWHALVSSPVVLCRLQAVAMHTVGSVCPSCPRLPPCQQFLCAGLQYGRTDCMLFVQIIVQRWCENGGYIEGALPIDIDISNPLRM